MTDWPRKHPWWADAARLYLKLITRAEATYRGVPRMTVPKYAAELAELKAFSEWVHWYNTGRRGPRPKFDLPVPRWAWLIEAEFHKAHPHPPPGPPPPPPAQETVSRWKQPPWQGIGLHVAWGFHSGQWTPQQLADKIAGTRVQWSALEGNPAMENEPYMDAYRDALHAHGRRFGIWERADTQKSFPGSFADHINSWITRYRPDFYGADIEVFPVDEPGLPDAIAKAHPDVPRLMIVPGQPDAPYLKPWIDADFDLMSEAYAANIGKPPVPGIAGPCDHDFFWRGGPRNFVPVPKGWGSEWWQHGTGPHTVPILEVNGEGNPGLREQLESDAVKWFGGNYSVWLAEQMDDDDWALVS